MTVLTSLASPSTPLSPTPPDASATPAGRERDLKVRAVDYIRPVRDSLQDRPRPAGTRQANARRPEDERGSGLRGPGSRAVAPRPEAAGAPRAAVSAPFLVQVFDQDLARPQVFVAEHRDAAVRGSEAYRRAGATPPIYSEQPTLFRIAV